MISFVYRILIAFMIALLVSLINPAGHARINRPLTPLNIGNGADPVIALPWLEARKD